MRAGEAAGTPSDEQVSRGGFCEVEERGPGPVRSYAHGGMVIGNSRTGIDLAPDWARGRTT